MDFVFDENQIQLLFGYEAAEDESPDRLKSYYFHHDTYKKICNDLPLRILVGHKGVGKSALFKIMSHEKEESTNIVVWIKPDDIMELCTTPDSFLQMIRDWKSGLEEKIFKMIISSAGIEDDKYNIVGKGLKIMDRLATVFSKFVEDKGVDVSSLKSDVVRSYMSKKTVYVFVDDLDRGWDGDNSGIKRISALINAARDMTTENNGLHFRISLRSDVYYLVRTSDESTDKIDGSVIWLKWTQHQILIMLAMRIQTYLKKPVDEKKLLSMPQFKIAELIYEVFEDRFIGYGKWADVPTHKVLASMIRRRPRDLVKLCTLAAREANDKQHNKINSNDLMEIFDTYSQDRLQDTINEYHSELPDIGNLLLGMKPSRRERKTEDEFTYTTEDLLKKIEIIMLKKSFSFSNEKVATAEDIAGFLYKINFIIARKRDNDGRIDRRYFEDHKYLSNKFIDFGYQWEVHPAFRWALYPDAASDIFTSLSIDNEL